MSLVADQLDGFYSRVSVTECPVNASNPAPKTGALQISHKTHNGNFLKNRLNDFD
jgi:hypothetical protein